MSGECRVSVVCAKSQEGATFTAAATTSTSTTTATTISGGTTTTTATTTTTTDTDAGSSGSGGGSDVIITSVCVCLVCDRRVKEAPASHLQQSLHGSSSFTSNPLQPPLAPLLEEVIKESLQQDEIESHRLCQRCFRLLEELDGLRQRSETIKNSLSSWYNKSLIRRLSLQTTEHVIPKSVKPEGGSSTTNTHAENVMEESICLKVEVMSEEEAETVFRFEEEEEEELKPEDQGIRPDDPEFNPAYDNAWLVGRGTRSRGRRRGRGRGRSRGRGRGRGMGRGPGRPPKNTKENLSPETKTGESLGEKLGELVTKMLEGEEEEEVNEQVFSKGEEEKLKIKKEQGERESEEDKEDSEERLSKGTTVAAVREGGQRVEGDVLRHCQWCGVQSASSHEAALHTASHTCPQCGLVVTRPSALSHHLQVVHGAGRGGSRHCHTCSSCGRQYASAGGLHNHFMAAHSGRVYKCSQCDRTFGHPRNLASHQVRHKERRVCCPRCPAKFFLRGELHKHLNQVHRRCRPYTCHDCGRSFCQRSVLRHHRTIHATPNHTRPEIHASSFPPAPQSSRTGVASTLNTSHLSSLDPPHSSSLNPTQSFSNFHVMHPSRLHATHLSSNLPATHTSNLHPTQPIPLNSIKVQRVRVKRAMQGVPQPSPSSHFPYPSFDLFEEVLGFEGEVEEDRQILLVKGGCEEGVESATLILEKGSDATLRLEGGSDTDLRLEEDLMLP